MNERKKNDGAQDRETNMEENDIVKHCEKERQKKTKKKKTSILKVNGSE